MIRRYLVAVDPGKNTGLAFFIDGMLARIGCISPKNFAYNLELFTGGVHQCAMTYVVEIPEIYRSRHSKGDPNHLIPLAKQCGMVQGLAETNGALYHEYKPKAWKGQLPKHVMRNRIKALRILTPHEEHVLQTTPFSKEEEHNAWDALGLGLWHLKRLKLR